MTVNIIRNRDEFVDALRLGIDGEVLTAGADYDDARATHFPVRIANPLAVVRPKHVDDVAAAVDAARLTGLSLFVRSGAHHGAAHSTGDGLLLDLRSLDNVDIDIADRTAWVGTGLTVGEVAWALAPYGLAIGFGDTGSVGVGGLTLGGGIGFLSRLYGMTIDNVITIEIVTADGRVHIVDHEHEPDLFWAVRDGGGQFRCRHEVSLPAGRGSEGIRRPTDLAGHPGYRRQAGRGLHRCRRRVDRHRQCPAGAAYARHSAGCTWTAHHFGQDLLRG